MLGKMARGMKDGALAMSAKAWLNEKFADYGEVIECRIDSKANRFSVTALLTGENESITATIERYQIEAEISETYVVLHEFSCSREWIGLLLAQIFEGKRYKIPSAVAKLL